MKLYALVQRFLTGRFMHCFVLFFITISIAAVIASSFSEMLPYRIPLFAVTYISSFVFLVEFVARIFASPARYPERSIVSARLRYTFSFYGFVDFVAKKNANSGMMKSHENLTLRTCIIKRRILFLPQILIKTIQEYD